MAVILNGNREIKEERDENNTMGLESPWDARVVCPMMPLQKQPCLETKYLSQKKKKNQERLTKLCYCIVTGWNIFNSRSHYWS